MTFVAPDTTGCTDFTYLLPGTISVYLLRVQVRVLLSSNVLSISQESELCFASSWRKRRGALYWFRWCMRSIFLVEVRCNISVLGYLVWIIPGTYRTVCASSLTTVRLRVPFVCLLIIYLMTGSFLHLIHDTYQPILRLFTCSTSWHGPAISQALPQALPYKPITAMHTSTSYCSML